MSKTNQQLKQNSKNFRKTRNAMQSLQAQAVYSITRQETNMFLKQPQKQIFINTEAIRNSCQSDQNQNIKSRSKRLSKKFNQQISLNIMTKSQTINNNLLKSEQQQFKIQNQKKICSSLQCYRNKKVKNKKMFSNNKSLIKKSEIITQINKIVENMLNENSQSVISINSINYQSFNNLNLVGQNQNQNHLITQQSQLIIQPQIKLFFQRHLQPNKLNIQQIMARKIQRVWKNFKTRNIIKRFLVKPSHQNFFNINKLKKVRKIVEVKNNNEEQSANFLQQIIKYGESTVNNYINNFKQTNEKPFGQKQNQLQSKQNEQILKRSEQQMFSSNQEGDKTKFTVFSQIFKSLKIKNSNEIQKRQYALDELRLKYEAKIITDGQYQQQRLNFLNKAKQKSKQIHRIQKSLKKAYQRAKEIISKQQKSLQFQHLHNIPHFKLKKCVSQDFLYKNNLKYIKFIEQNLKQTQKCVRIRIKQKTSTLNNESSDQEKSPIELSRKYSNYQRQQEQILSQQNTYQPLQQQKQEQKQTQNQCQFSTSLIEAEEIKIFNLKGKKDITSLTEKQKNSIFQILFLDLIFQFFMDFPQQSQALCTIENSYHKMGKLYKNRMKGLKDTNSYVQQYLVQIQKFIKGNSQNLLEGMKMINGPKTIDMLKYLRYQDIEDQQDIVEPVLQRKVYEQFFKKYQKSIIIQQCFLSEEKQQRWEKYIKNLNLIYSKAIFDCLNQFLDCERPFGILGNPYPWKCSITKTKINKFQQQFKLSRACLKVLQNIQFKCGLIKDNLSNKYQIKQQFLQEHRQNRLLKMLKKYQSQQEKTLIFYEDQQLQILVQISNEIFMQLLKEQAKQIGRL